MSKTPLVLAFLLAAVPVAHAASAASPVYRLIYSPPRGSPTAYPGFMFEVSPGLFYFDSSYSNVTISSLTAPGALNSLYTFNPAIQAIAFLQGTNGSLFGSGFLNQGSGSPSFYFSISASGSNLKEYPPPAAWAAGGLTILAPPGEYYDFLGSSSGPGTQAFAQISETGVIKVLYQLSPEDALPVATYNLVYGPDGNIYGIGSDDSGNGFLFRVTQSGTYTRLPNSAVAFDGAWGQQLIVGSDGYLYGTNAGGSRGSPGYIFKANLAGAVQTVVSFGFQSNCPYGCGPESLLQASDGNFYGATGSNAGYAYRYDLSTGQLSEIFDFAKTTAPPLCFCRMFEGMDGLLYGVATLGGNSPGEGAIWSLDIGLPKPKPQVSGIYPSSGKVGEKIILWGNYLLGATAVAFTGAPASTFLSTSMQSVQVTVPTGATTGPVTVTTANGSYATTQNFTVQ